MPEWPIFFNSTIAVVKTKSYRQGDYTFPRGTTVVTSSAEMVPFSALQVTDEEVMEL